MYAKVFASMWDGTLYGKWEAWSVFVFLLAHCNADGNVDIHPSAIAARSGLPLEVVLKGLAVLNEPDQNSRTKDSDGRRIELIDDHRDWGWHVVNYLKYRSLRDSDEVRSQTRERLARHREMKRSVTLGNADVTLGNALKRSVTLGNALKRQEEVEVEVEEEAEKKKSQRPRARGINPLEITPEHVQRAAARFKLPEDTVAYLAEKIALEGPERGYRNYPSALLTWCRREALNPSDPPPAKPPRPEEGETQDGEVWFKGGWRSQGMAEHLGWKAP
jgi:hypothetical protein